MIPLLLLAGLLLLACPHLMLRLRAHPAHLARHALALPLIGFALVEAGLLLWAAPALLDLVGATDLAQLCRRMLGGLVPGDWPAGAAAGVVAVVLAVVAVRGARRASRVQRAMRVEPWLGTHDHRDDHHLVVIPTERLVAYSVPGQQPQVVMSEGLVDAVGQAGVEAVCAHEMVHVRYHHHRYLVVLAGIVSALRWYPPAVRGVAMVRLALERWADEEAGESTREGRQGVRRALLAATLTQVGPDVAAFGPADTVVARLRALSNPPPRSSPRIVAAGYFLVWLAGGTAAVSLGWASGMAILAVANPGLCVL